MGVSGHLRTYAAQSAGGDPRQLDAGRHDGTGTVCAALRKEPRIEGGPILLLANGDEVCNKYCCEVLTNNQVVSRAAPHNLHIEDAYWSAALVAGESSR